MFDTQIHTTFVATGAEVARADAVEVLEGLVGDEIKAGSARLLIEAEGRPGAFDSVSWRARLRTGFVLSPSIPVEVVVTPWSASRTEIGISPLGRVGRPGSLRLSGFFRAAWPVVDALIQRVVTSAPVTSDRAAPVLQVAA